MTDHQELAYQLSMEALLDLIRDLMDKRPCELDEPGWRCETHGNRTPCPHGFAQRVVGRAYGENAL